MIAKNSFIIMVTQGLSALLGMIGLFVVSKLWGSSAPGLLGIIWFGMTFVGTFSFLYNMGFDAAHVKKVSEGKDLARCNGTYIAIKLILVSILVLTVLGGIAIWKYVLNNEFYDSTRETVIYLFLGYWVFFGLAQIPIMTFNSLKKNVKSQITWLMEPLFRVPAMIVVVLAGVSGAYLVNEGADTTFITLAPLFEWPSFLSGLQEFISTHAIGAMASTYLFSSFAMCIVGFMLLRKYPIAKPSREYMTMYTKYAIPLMIPLILTIVNTNIDKVMLGYFWTSNEVGQYYAVQRITSMVLMISSAIGIVLFPTISKVHAKYKDDKIKRNKIIANVTHKSQRYTSMVTVPLLFVMIVFAVPIIDIYLNSSFRPAAFSMRILAIYTLIATLIVPYRYLVLGMNKPGLAAKVVVMGGVSNVVLNLLFIPEGNPLSHMGIEGPSGAAIAILISALIMLAGFQYYSRRMVRRPLFQAGILKHLLAASLMAIMMWYVVDYLSPLSWLYLLVLGSASLGIYIVLIWAMGEFKKDDFNFFWDTVNPMNLFRYMRTEMREKPDR